MLKFVQRYAWVWSCTMYNIIHIHLKYENGYINSRTMYYVYPLAEAMHFN